jgi:4-amino-4-deoxy-L-arabinose transferase-like glycosyltransferase
VSSTGHDSEDLIGPAAVAVWRRRQEACAEVVSPADDDQQVNGHSLPDHGDAGPADGRQQVNGHSSQTHRATADSDGAANRANGFHTNGHAALNGSTGSAGREFSHSQQAGLTTIFNLAKLEAPSQPQPAAGPAGPELEQPASAHDGNAGDTLVGPPAVIHHDQAVDQVGTSDRPSAVSPDRAPAAEPRDSWTARVFRYLHVPRLSLFVILTVQAVLSLRLVWSNSAFTDEALYLWAGRLEWSHWLHGTPIPPFSAYFSGSPIVYPAIGALAGGIDGLTGARILSLCFMLGATSLLWATANRLYGRRAGLFAAGLWAFLGPTLKLGAFATFDPMSLFLVALSVWCAVRASERRDFTRWIVASAAALVLANAAAYSSAIFDPVVVAVALLAGWDEQSMKLAKMRAAALAAYVTSVLILLIDAGRGSYWAGISDTVLSRASGTTPAVDVLSVAWRWMAPVAVVAVAGLLICAVAERTRSRQALLAVLAGALLLAPIEQARIHTITSLDKHTDIGAWFAAIAAGYGASALTRLGLSARTGALVAAVSVGALAFPAVRGISQSQELFSWPNSQPFVNAFRPLAARTNGPLLVEAPSPVRYYLGSAVQWERWSSTWAITLPNGTSIGSSRGGVTSPGIPGIYIDRIDDGYFALVALNSTTTPKLDAEITDAMIQSRRYRLVASVPYDASYYAGYYVIWERIAGGSTG